MCVESDACVNQSYRLVRDNAWPETFGPTNALRIIRCVTWSYRLLWDNAWPDLRSFLHFAEGQSSYFDILKLQEISQNQNAGTISVRPRFNDPWASLHVTLVIPNSGGRRGHFSLIFISTPNVEACSQEHCDNRTVIANKITGKTPGQQATVSQCCFEEDGAERWYEGVIKSLQGWQSSFSNMLPFHIGDLRCATSWIRYLAARVLLQQTESEKSLRLRHHQILTKVSLHHRSKVTKFYSELQWELNHYHWARWAHRTLFRMAVYWSMTYPQSYFKEATRELRYRYLQVHRCKNTKSFFRVGIYEKRHL
jgi:hypothetical protein